MKRVKLLKRKNKIVLTKILLCEDDEALRNMVAEFLKQSKLEVHDFSDPSFFLKKTPLQDINGYSLVLTDLEMPFKRGD